MGVNKVRYCCKAFKSKWRLWDRKMSKWWGPPFPHEPWRLMYYLNDHAQGSRDQGKIDCLIKDYK